MSVPQKNATPGRNRLGVALGMGDTPDFPFSGFCVVHSVMRLATTTRRPFSRSWSQVDRVMSLSP